MDFIVGGIFMKSLVGNHHGIKVIDSGSLIQSGGSQDIVVGIDVEGISSNGARRDVGGCCDYSDGTGSLNLANDGFHIGEIGIDIRGDGDQGRVVKSIPSGGQIRPMGDIPKPSIEMDYPVMLAEKPLIDIGKYKSTIVVIARSMAHACKRGLDIGRISEGDRISNEKDSIIRKHGGGKERQKQDEIFHRILPNYVS